MTESRSSRLILLRISGHCPINGLAARFSVPVESSLFIVVVAIFHDEGAAAVFTFESLFVGGENIIGFLEPDDVDVGAHKPKGLRVVTDMLMLRMQWPFGSDAGAHNRFAAKTGT